MEDNNGKQEHPDTIDVSVPGEDTLRSALFDSITAADLPDEAMRNTLILLGAISLVGGVAARNKDRTEEEEEALTIVGLFVVDALMQIGPEIAARAGKEWDAGDLF